MSDPTLPGPRSKRATRQTLRAIRDSLTREERATAAAAIARSTNALIATRLQAGDVLAVYAAKGTEVDTTAIAEDAIRRGITLTYPRVVAGDRTLVFHAVTAAELAPGQFGLKEPHEDAPVIALDQITAFVIPGLAFDREGGRTGWGMGHYDATLALAPSPLRIGLAFECQVIDRVPRDAHDIPMSHVITEVATYTVA
ncbi:MAG: 5-formyltetrahydrofolate cyclo-ligase [Deltaproteobacteria bacterium]|nr:5-formyltetrahydrofolate cyclo-ligase [Deltaproteobacteria bacterium]